MRISPFLILSLVTLANADDNQDCARCHEQFAAQCNSPSKAIQHKFANRNIDEKFDKKAFSAPNFQHGGKSYSFSWNDASAKIVETDLENGKEKTWFPKMAIGVSPLVQYVIEGERGALQVMTISYNTTTHEWFDSLGNETRKTGEWGHWQSKGMNWNSNCAYCHMSNFKKNYTPITDSYQSTWTEHGIGCLQCHPSRPEKCGTEEVFKGRPSKNQRMDSCASCHSRREELSANKFKLGDKYFDHFRPELPLVDGVYYPDGKVKDECFVFSSFMMSRQYDAGLTCMDCHDPHTLKLFRPANNNVLCMQCHSINAKRIKNAPVIEPKKHSAHGDNEGNLCVNCHMPQTAYMQADFRYDHGFTSPDPYLTKHALIPNACTECHKKIDKDKPERDENWLLENFEKEYGSERFLRKRKRAIAVYKFHKAEYSDTLRNELLELFKSESNYAWQATLAQMLSVWIENKEVDSEMNKALKSENPLLRSAAVRALSILPDSKEKLEALLEDSCAMVRIDSAFALRKNLKDESRYAELIEYLDFNSDRPIGALKRAEFAIARNELESAREYALHALSMEKSNPELAIQCAIMLNKAKDNTGAINLLENFDAPDANIKYSLSLLFANVGNLERAAKEMQIACELSPENPRTWYNLSIMRFKLGDKNGALEAIDKAIQADSTGSDEYKAAKDFFKTQE